MLNSDRAEDVSADPAATLRVRPSLSLLLATGLGLGRSPVMPGTVGALWGLPLAVGIGHLPGAGPLSAVVLQSAAILALILLGIPLCTAAAHQLGAAKDPQAVVWDEIATMPIVFFLVPLDPLSRPLVLLAGFVLHRVFDIAKPPPCRRLERLRGGLGIMADDCASSVYACLTLHALLWLTPLGRGG